MPITYPGITTDPNGYVPPLDNTDDLGNDYRGFRAIYGSNAGQSLVYGNIGVRGILNTVQLATPGAPTLATVGTAGATTYGYRVVATVLGGAGASLVTARSNETTIATGNAALSANNYIRITWASVAGATGYLIYRTTGGATQGLIATITNGNTVVLNDTGLVGGGETPSTVNLTGEFNLAGLGSFRPAANGTDVILDKITTGGILYLFNRADAEGVQVDFTNNVLEFSATGWGIRAAKADASTLLFQAQNAAGQTQTVAQITGNATVANSTFDITKGRLTGNLQIGAYYISNDGGNEGLSIGSTGGSTITVAANSNVPPLTLTVSNNGHTGGALSISNLGGIWGAVNAAITLVDTTATRFQVFGNGDVNIHSTAVYKVNAVQVVGARVVDARCDDAINTGDATSDGVIDALRDAMIAHGLIAAA